MPVGAVKSKLEARLGADEHYREDPRRRSIHRSKKTWKT
jgi:hypothetical protein